MPAKPSTTNSTMMISTARRLAASLRNHLQAIAATADELERLLVMLQQHQLGHGPREPKRENAEDPAAQELDMIGAHAARFHKSSSSMIPTSCRLSAAAIGGQRSKFLATGVAI
jgi:hypothetical protein